MDILGVFRENSVHTSSIEGKIFKKCCHQAKWDTSVLLQYAILYAKNHFQVAKSYQEAKQPCCSPILFTCNRDRERFAKGKNDWLQMLWPQFNEMNMNVGAQPLFEARQTCCLHCSRGPTICLRAPRISTCH